MATGAAPAIPARRVPQGRLGPGPPGRVRRFRRLRGNGRDTAGSDRPSRVRRRTVPGPRSSGAPTPPRKGRALRPAVPEVSSRRIRREHLRDPPAAHGIGGLPTTTYGAGQYPSPLPYRIWGTHGAGGPRAGQHRSNMPSLMSARDFASRGLRRTHPDAISATNPPTARVLRRVPRPAQRPHV